MAVPTSNITLSSIQQEFGGAAANRKLKNYYGAAAGVPTSGAIKFKDFAGKSADIVGSQKFTSSGTFTVPAGVTKVHVCCVGGGGRGSPNVDVARSGGTGGACAYKNNIAVTPGQQITVNVTVDGDVGMEVGTYFKNTSTCNARTGFQTATSLGAANTGDAAFRGGMGGNGGDVRYLIFSSAYHIYTGGGGGGAASMVAPGGQGGNGANVPNGNTNTTAYVGGNGGTSSRAGGGGGGAGSGLNQQGNYLPDYAPDITGGGGWFASHRGGGVGVVTAGSTGAAGLGSVLVTDPNYPSGFLPHAPTKGGNGSNGNYGAGGGAGRNPADSSPDYYKGKNGAVNIKWGNSNTFPWA